MQLSIVIEKDEHGYYAYCPALKGCQSEGDTLEEAARNMREAVELYLQTMSEEELKTCLSKEVFTTTVQAKVARAA